jgi:hypothetical protein
MSLLPVGAPLNQPRQGGEGCGELRGSTEVM